MEGLMRVAAAVPKLRLGNVKENAAAIAEMLRQAAAEQASLAVFPELCLTGYTCGDLFFQKPLLQATEAALDTLREDVYKRQPQHRQRTTYVRYLKLSA